MTTYAIVETGGKQYRVRPGDRIDVEKLDSLVGSTVELTNVLAVSRDGEITAGTPFVEGVKVLVEVDSLGRGKKLIVFKYKSKVRYRRKMGHRQPYSTLIVKDIVTETPDQAPPSVRKPRARKKVADGT